MRSEERSGIVFVIMLFMWGTLFTEPLRIFADYLMRFILKVCSFLKLEPASIATSIIVTVFFAGLTVALLLLSCTGAVRYTPLAITGLSIMFFLRDCLKHSSVNSKTAWLLLIFCALIGVFHLFKLDSALVWATDFYISALPVYLLVSWILFPIAKLNGIVGKILYITRYATFDFASSFSGLFSIPGLVWGIFIYILVFVFITYFTFSRRNG